MSALPARTEVWRVLAGVLVVTFLVVVRIAFR